MPTFYAQKTTVQLSVTDLGRATTTNPRRQQSLAASESIKNVAQEFARGSKDGTLTETPLYTEDGSHIRFLGKHEDMPFFMVHAGNNFFDLATKEKTNRRPARVPLAGKGEGKSASTAVDLDGETVSIRTSKDGKLPQLWCQISDSDCANSSPVIIEPNSMYKPPLIPHALCLTVFLSNSSFVRTTDRGTTRKEINDVKIDVYFNGALCGSHYVPRRYSGEAYAMTEHIVRFTGRRIGRLIEKPWVIVPSGQNPDGGLREYRRGKVAYAGAQQRWNDISDALMAEADKIGQDGRAERPVIGEYLESLAQLSMPKDVEDMQKAGSPKYGVLDVVVIWGKGNKNGPDAPYIVEPTPIRNEGFSNTDLDQLMDHVPVQNAPKLTDSPYTVPKSRSEALTNAKSVDEYLDTSSLSVTTSLLPPSNNGTSPAASSPTKKRPLPALPFETPLKRSRGHYYDILTTKQTLSEEINSIATAAGFGPRAGYNPTILTHSRTPRVDYASTAGSSPLSSAPTTTNHTPAQTKIVKIKLPSPTKSAPSPCMMTTPRMEDGEADGEFPTPLRERPPAPPKRRERVPTQPNAEALDGDFRTPALAVDCNTTYAPGGIVRNVGAARGGVFREGGVVMGARFVVGG